MVIVILDELSFDEVLRTMFFDLSRDERGLFCDGWMTCDCMSFSTVFESYLDDERVITKGCVQWNTIYG